MKTAFAAGKRHLPRLKALLSADIRFQFRYGLYFIYMVFTVLYLGLLSLFPETWRNKAGIFMIFTDPAALGLFFMGAVVLFEKSERVLNSLAISPVKIEEYVLSKLLSLAVISTAVGVLIAIGAGCTNNIACTIAGVFISSCLFSSIGLIVAAKIKTLNQFMIAAVPAEILLDLPAIAYLFGFNNRWLLLHPGVSAIELIGGGKYSLYALFILLIWTALFFIFSRLIVGRMMQSVGGIKL